MHAPVYGVTFDPSRMIKANVVQHVLGCLQSAVTTMQAWKGVGKGVQRWVCQYDLGIFLGVVTALTAQGLPMLSICCCCCSGGERFMRLVPLSATACLLLHHSKPTSSNSSYVSGLWACPTMCCPCLRNCAQTFTLSFCPHLHSMLAQL